MDGIDARSAGTEPSARARVSAKLLQWADVVFVMEQKHKRRIAESFPNEVQAKTIVVLDIPDEYQYMDDELIAMIKDSVDAYIE